MARRKYRRFRPWMLNGHPGNVSWKIKRVIVRAVNYGLVVTSTTGGRHSAGSYHYHGRAVDVAAPMTSAGKSKMRKFQRNEFKRFRRWHWHRELFGPLNDSCISRGRACSLAEGSALEQQHDNHVHVAL